MTTKQNLSLLNMLQNSKSTELSCCNLETSNKIFWLWLYWPHDISFFVIHCRLDKFLVHNSLFVINKQHLHCIAISPDHCCELAISQGRVQCKYNTYGSIIGQHCHLAATRCNKAIQFHIFFRKE